MSEQGEIIDPVNTNVNSTSKITQEEREKLAEEEMKKLINDMKSENLMSSGSQINRLLNTNFINPYEILLLKPDASEEDIKKQYRQLSLLIHPDKCSEENAADAFHVMEQAYKTLLNSDKRKTFQRVYREAKERVTYEREKENRRRKLKGLSSLPEDTLEIQINIEMKKIKEEVEERKAYADKQDFAHKKRERDDDEERKIHEEYEKQQKKEWESYRDKRVKNWNKFQQKNTGGKKKGKYEMRPPQHKMIEKAQTYNIDIFRPNI